MRVLWELRSSASVTHALTQDLGKLRPTHALVQDHSCILCEVMNMNGLVGTFVPDNVLVGLFEPEASRVQGERSTVELRAQ